MCVVQSVAFSGPTKLINNAHLTNFPSRLDERRPTTSAFQSAGTLVTARTTSLFRFPFYRHRLERNYTSLPHISLRSTRLLTAPVHEPSRNFITARFRARNFSIDNAETEGNIVLFEGTHTRYGRQVSSSVPPLFHNFIFIRELKRTCAWV